MAHFYLLKKHGIFILVKTHSITEFNVRVLPDRFKEWARALIKYYKVRYAIVTNIVLNHNMIRDC